MYSGDGSFPLSTIESMKTMALKRDGASILVQDDTCLGGLVMVLSNNDTNIVCTALETLFQLAEWPEHRNRMRNFIGMTDQLKMLMTRSNGRTQDLAVHVHNLLVSSSHTNSSNHSHAHHHHHQHQHHQHQEPLKDTVNQQKQHTEGGSHHRQKPKRRNSFFVGSIGNTKMITLHIRGMHDRDDMDVCRNTLLTVKGVVSITFDFNQKRAILRTKPDLQPEVLGQAIARSMTMLAEQVMKDEAGNEVLVSFRANASNQNKENEEMPDYPSDDSPIKGDNNMACPGAASPHKPLGGFFKSVGSFLSNTLYW